VAGGASAVMLCEERSAGLAAGLARGLAAVRGGSDRARECWGVARARRGRFGSAQLSACWEDLPGRPGGALDQRGHAVAV
jgi:hypothetical protein